MVFYYALGGGLGHLVRAKKVLRALSINKFKVISAHKYIPNELFNSEQILTLPHQWSTSPEKVLPWLNLHLQENNVQTIFIDTFPIGLCGEIRKGFSIHNIETVYVARYLKWPDYKHAIQYREAQSLMQFNACYIVDELHPEQQAFVDSHCDNVQHLSIEHSPPLRTRVDASAIKPLVKNNTWLIAHSMPVNELSELLHYAQEIADLDNEHAHFLICSAIDDNLLPKEFHSENVSLINIYPVNSLFSECARIVSACGYNIMNETLKYADKHHFIPFPRRYDDQYRRAEKRREHTVF